MKKGCTTAPTARSESAKPQSKTTDGERSVGVFQTACNTSKFPIIDVMARGMFTAQLITRTFFTASVMFPPTVVDSVFLPTTYLQAVFFVAKMS